MGLGIKRIDNLKLGQDPILSEYAQKFENSDFVSNLILPEVRVAKQSGKYPIFGNEHMRINDTSRPLKSPIKQMPLDDWTMKEFLLESFGLEAAMDYLEIEASSEVLDLEKYAMNSILDSIELQKEYKAVELLTSASTYSNDHYLGLGAGEHFNDSSSDPITILRDAMETIRMKINRKPNIMVFGQPTFNALQNHPKLLELIKYTQIGIVTEDLIETLLSTKDHKVTVRVGSGMYEDKASAENKDLWSDVVVMAYNKKIGGAKLTQYDQSFGKTFVQKGYPWAARSTDRNGIINYVATLTMYKSYITQKDAGLCIHGTVGEINE
ncbi:MAG: major capsid protein [Candidatus Kapabacteria bacterium]|nr:major capsid protein [Ignavibacteriota bacterium]MCW5886357.1 major capsid protein [Candidatus Kapabacteria bacterium]